MDLRFNKTQKPKINENSVLSNISNYSIYNPMNISVDNSINITPFIVNKSTRTLLDPLYGHIDLPSKAWEFIDKPEFQRLRNLRQLGNNHLVFPGGTHTRFEHSIGTGYLAREAVVNLLNNSESDLSDGRELREQIESVTLAGVMHDIGHGPFSHLFDSLLKELSAGYSIDKELLEHEHRSGLLLEYMIDRHSIDMPPEQRRLIQSLITGEGKPDWLFQIVANQKNSIDVDKFDYICRDSYHIGVKGSKVDWSRVFKNVRIIDSRMVYSVKNDFDLFTLFQSRHRLFKEVYLHKTVMAVDCMVKDILRSADPYFRFLESIQNMKDYCVLDDGILDRICLLADNIDYVEDIGLSPSEIKNAETLIQRIRCRDLYSLVKEFLVPERLCDNVKGIRPEDLCDEYRSIRREDIVVCFFSIDFGNRDKSIYDNIEFYNSNGQVVKTSSTRVSGTLPRVFKESYLRVYYKYKDEGKISHIRQTLESLLNRLDLKPQDSGIKQIRAFDETPDFLNKKRHKGI